MSSSYVRIHASAISRICTHLYLASREFSSREMQVSNYISGMNIYFSQCNRPRLHLISLMYNNYTRLVINKILTVSLIVAT